MTNCNHHGNKKAGKIISEFKNMKKEKNIFSMVENLIQYIINLFFLLQADKNLPKIAILLT